MLWFVNCLYLSTCQCLNCICAHHLHYLSIHISIYPSIYDVTVSSSRPIYHTTCTTGLFHRACPVYVQPCPACMQHNYHYHYLLSTLNSQPSTINHQPSTINHQPSTSIIQQNIMCFSPFSASPATWLV